METILSNISGNVRKASLHGRSYYVAPLSLIVPGVLDGSDGPGYYGLDQMARNPKDWNGMPLTVYHPIKNGVHISARDPLILDKQGIGIALNTEVNGKLATEAWVDIELAKKVDNRVIKALELDEKMEISTGLTLEKVPAEPGAIFNGTPYNWIAKNFKPDHIAILPDQKGACDIDQGCGLNVNQERNVIQKFWDFLTNAKHKQSHDDLRMQLQNAVSQRYGHEAFLVDVFDKQVIYAHNEKLWSINYAVKNEKAELSEDATTEVRKQTTYQPVTNKVTATPIKGDNNMSINEERKAIVDFLVSNCECWKGEEETLNKFSDDRLKEFKEAEEKRSQAITVANAAKKGFEDPGGNKHTFNAEKQVWETEKVVANKDGSKEQTDEEWYATAPPNIQRAVKSAMESERRDREQLINRLVTNSKEDAREGMRKIYTGMPSDQLQTLVGGLSESPGQKLPQPFPDYSGAATPAVVNVDDNVSSGLPLPQTIRTIANEKQA